MARHDLGVFDVGAVVQLAATFTDDDGTPADPGDVVLRIADPDGGVSEIDIDGLTHTGDGRFEYAAVASEPAKWWKAGWYGTDGVTAVLIEDWYVRPYPFDGPTRVIDGGTP